MNNYNSTEFHKWLCKKQFPTEEMNIFSKINTDAVLKSMIEKEDYYVDGKMVYGFAQAASWQPYRKVVLEWLDDYLSKFHPLQTLVNKWKTTIQTEIALLKEILNHE